MREGNKTISFRKVRCLAAVLGCSIPAYALSAPRKTRTIFGGGYGASFYTSPELSSINERMGNSPRLTVEHEFGRAKLIQATFEQSERNDIWVWGGEFQQWGESYFGQAKSGGETPRSESGLSFLRFWLTGGVRLWPWIGPTIVKQNTNFTGVAVRMAKSRALGSGLFSWLRVTTGPLLWRHSYLLSDTENQTEINYALQSVAWEGGLRWTLGWRLGSFCDLGVDVVASRSLPVKTETIVGQYILSGRESLDSSSDLGVEGLAKARWQTFQSLVFIRFFFP